MTPRLASLSFKRCRMCNRRCLRSSMIGILCTASWCLSRTIQTALRCPCPESFARTSYWTSCRLCFVVDLVEEILGEGGSRSSWQVHEHDSSQLVSQQNVAIRVFWSRCQPRLTLIARDLCHGKQRVSPFYHDLSLLPKLSSDFHERNVGESFAQSRQQLVARDFHHGKQRVSPFFHVSQLFHKRTCFDLLRTGCFSCSSLRANNGFHRSIMIWVSIWFWLSSNFWTQFFIQSCFKEIFGGGRGDAYTFLCMTSTFGIQ